MTPQSEFFRQATHTDFDKAYIKIDNPSAIVHLFLAHYELLKTCFLTSQKCFQTSISGLTQCAIVKNKKCNNYLSDKIHSLIEPYNGNLICFKFEKLNKIKKGWLLGSLFYEV